MHFYLFRDLFIALLSSHSCRSTCRLHFSASFVQQIHFLVTLVLFFFCCVRKRVDCYDPITSRCGTILCIPWVGMCVCVLAQSFIKNTHTDIINVCVSERNELYVPIPVDALRVQSQWAHIKAKQRNAINIYLSAISQFAFSTVNDGSESSTTDFQIENGIVLLITSFIWILQKKIHWQKDIHTSG